MSRQKKLLMWTVFIIAMVQMVGTALSPALSQIKTVVFPDRSLADIQTAFTLPGLISPLVALLSAMLIRRGVVTKKAVVITGLFLLGLAGLLSFVLHHAFWQLKVLCILMGIASGCYLSTTISILMDNFSPDERQKVTGIQAVFVNIGGFLAGLFGGMLAAWTWYGGFLILLVGIPMGIFAIFSIPRETRIDHKSGGRNRPKAKFKSDIFFYGATLLVFMLIFGVSGGNLAVHLSNSGFKNTALIGVVTAIQAVGGASFGLIFSWSLKKFQDKLLVAAFVILFVSYSMLNLFHTSIVLMCAAAFLTGLSLSVIGPYCVVATAQCVDVSTSALATSIITGIAPGLGGFLSPILFTNLTNAIVRDSTNFRYQFVAFASLIFGMILAVFMALRRKRRTAQGQPDS